MALLPFCNSSIDLHQVKLKLNKTRVYSIKSVAYIRIFTYNREPILSLYLETPCRIKPQKLTQWLSYYF